MDFVTRIYQNTVGGTSYIDHCIYSSNLKNMVSDCGVMEEHVLNTSDHLPIYLKGVVNC